MAKLSPLLLAFLVVVLPNTAHALGLDETAKMTGVGSQELWRQGDVALTLVRDLGADALVPNHGGAAIEPLSTSLSLTASLDLNDVVHTQSWFQLIDDRSAVAVSLGGQMAIGVGYSFKDIEDAMANALLLGPIDVERQDHQFMLHASLGF